MLFELVKGDYEKVRLLFKEMYRDVSAAAVINGNNPGTIWVDNKNKPRSAFMDSPEGYILVGDPSNKNFSNALNKLFVEQIYPESSKKGKHSFEIHCTGIWEDRIYNVILKGKLPVKIPCAHYLFREMKIPDWKERLPEGFEIYRVDRQFLKKNYFKGFDEVISRVEEWGSVDNFIEKGFGFCLVHEDTIISRCIADCVSDTRCEIGIGTNHEYRNRGFGALTATATVEYSLDNGFSEIGWHTSQTNIASRKTALAVGFEKVEDYYVYSACFDEFDNYIQNGLYKIYNSQTAAEPEKYLEKAFAIKEPTSNLLFVIARSYAINGFEEMALNYLKKSVAKGFNDLEKLLDEESFEFLKDSDFLKTLAEKIRSKQK